MRRWHIVVWSGLALVVAAYVVPNLLSRTPQGFIPYLVIALVVVTGLLTWLAMRRRGAIRWLLVVASGALAAFISVWMVLLFVLTDSPAVDLIGWPFMTIGAVAAFLGSLASLRARDATPSETRP